MVGPNFFSPGDSHTKGLLVLLNLGLEDVTEVEMIQKGGLCTLRVLPPMTGLFVFMPLKGIAPGNSWLGGVSLKDYKIIWKIKVREMKAK